MEECCPGTSARAGLQCCPQRAGGAWRGCHQRGSCWPAPHCPACGQHGPAALSPASGLTADPQAPLGSGSPPQGNLPFWAWSCRPSGCSVPTPCPRRASLDPTLAPSPRAPSPPCGHSSQVAPRSAPESLSFPDHRVTTGQPVQEHRPFHALAWSSCRPRGVSEISCLDLIS